MNSPALPAAEPGVNGHNGHNGQNGHAPPMDDINRQGRRIQELVEQIDALREPAARTLMHECMESLLGFYGHGLERILHILKHAGIGGQQAYNELLHDRVVSGLLLIHGLHPVDLETRLREALEKIRPYMQSHGGNVELLGLEGEFARLRLQGACKTCPSSTVTMELAVRHAIEEACPDLMGFEVEGAMAAPEHHTAAPEWTAVEVLNVSLILCKSTGNLYAYRDRCPACNLPLHLGTLEAGVLACRAGHRYSVQKAGIGVDDSHLHLEPVPLVLEHGSVQVAIAVESHSHECGCH